MVNNLSNEEWKSVQGFEGLYEVSNMGRVKALEKTWVSGVNGCIVRSKPEHIMAGGLMRGYQVVTFNKNGKQSTPKVHKLVATAFIINDRPLERTQINHKNGIKTDNRQANLEWVTPQENSIHSIVTGLQVPRRRGQHSQAKRIKCETFDLDFSCIADAAEFFGIGRTKIERVCKSVYKHADGLTFRYN